MKAGWVCCAANARLLTLICIAHPHLLCSSSSHICTAMGSDYKHHELLSSWVVGLLLSRNRAGPEATSSTPFLLSMVKFEACTHASVMVYKVSMVLDAHTARPLVHGGFRGVPGEVFEVCQEIMFECQKRACTCIK
eukprot:1136799-Pelagomonas_calceolata.AAC.4